MPRRANGWLRLAKITPLIALGVLVGLWFSISPFMRTNLLAFAAAEAGTRQARLEILKYTDADRVGRTLKLTGSESALDVAGPEAWMTWIDSLPAVPSERDVFSPQLVGLNRFKKLEAWANRAHAKVWAWVVPGPPMPSVIASTTPNDVTYTALKGERHNLRQSGSPYAESPEAASVETMLWSESVWAGKRKPLDPSILQLGGGGGSGSSEYQMTIMSVRGESGLYRICVQSPGTGTDDTPDPFVFAEPFKKVEVDAADLELQIETMARKNRLNVWVWGPMEFDAVPLIVPEGRTASDSAALASAVWPKMAIDPNTGDVRMPQRLDGEVARLAGGEAGYMTVYGMNNSPLGISNTSYGLDEIAPQSVAFFVAFEKDPVALSGVQRMRQRWERLVVEWFPLAIGGALGLLVLSLVVSPAAFVYERRMLARQRALEEMEHLRRDAHDKVYNRLSALSKRVAAAGQQMSDESVGALGAIAEDIRETVGELQEILGDDVVKADSTLTTVSLAEQLASVGRAQAARLGVEVSVKVPDAVSDVSPSLGWDLQCIVEEAITNAAKHGSARHVVVEASALSETLILCVVDDGGGSSVLTPDAAGDGSSGLRGMRARLARHDGSLSIETSSAGTTLTIHVPLDA